MWTKARRAKSERRRTRSRTGTEGGRETVIVTETVTVTVTARQDLREVGPVLVIAQAVRGPESADGAGHL